MRVYIGRYKPWYSKDRFVDCVFWFLSESKRDKIVDWIPQSPFDVLNKLGGERNVFVRIDNYDTWNMDHTLALIIVPMLKQLKETKHGAPLVDDVDVPDSLKSSSTPPPKNDYDVDSNHFARWEYVLNEMIWTFEQKVDSNQEEQFYTEPEGKWSFKNPGSWDTEGFKKHNDRIDNGLRLFGKYYGSLWS